MKVSTSSSASTSCIQFFVGKAPPTGHRHAHYVSLSVRLAQGTHQKVAQCADLLFVCTFEPQFYAGLPLRAVFVGHPLAER